MIALRDVTATDKSKLLEWRNKAEIAKYMYTDHVISKQEHSDWFERALSDSTRRYWIITVDGRDVGLVNLYAIDRRHRTASWAFYIAESGLRGRGVGAFVEFTVLKHVFEELELRKLWCEVLAFNEPVVKMHQRFGFQVEGQFRAHVLKADQPVDVIRLGLLRDEWNAQKIRLEQDLRDKRILP